MFTIYTDSVEWPFDIFLIFHNSITDFFQFLKLFWIPSIFHRLVRHVPLLLFSKGWHIPEYHGKHRFLNFFNFKHVTACLIRGCQTPIIAHECIKVDIKSAISEPIGDESVPNLYYICNSLPFIKWSRLGSDLFSNFLNI